MKDPKERLIEAESLLSAAHSMLDNVHCYNTELYKEISDFLYGEDEE